MYKTKQTGLRLPEPLLDRIDSWCACQRPPVTRTALVTMVLTDWIDEQDRVRGTHRVGAANGSARKETAQ